jgi:hypothetical protein
MAGTTALARRGSGSTRAENTALHSSSSTSTTGVLGAGLARLITRASMSPAAASAATVSSVLESVATLGDQVVEAAVLAVVKAD